MPQHEHHVETVAALRAQAEKRSPPQRLIDVATAALGRPATIATLAMLSVAWVGFNLWAPQRALDPSPFLGLQMAVTIYSALISTFVLSTQNREKRHAEERADFELQVNLLAEQKTAKIISLIEELRRDLPSVPNRLDPQARAMEAPIDAEAALTMLRDINAQPADEEEERPDAGFAG